MMFTKKLFIIAAILLLAIIVLPVSAVNLNGTISASGWNSSNYADGGGLGNTGVDFKFIQFNDIEKSGSLQSLIYFNIYPGTNLMSFDSGAPSGLTTSFNARISNTSYYTGGDVIGTGTIGYQRLYDNALPTPNELAGGYVYLMFNEGSWNNSGLSGDLPVYIEYNRSALRNVTAPTQWGGNLFDAQRSGESEWISSAIIGHAYSGNYTYNRLINVYGFYNADKPSGLGISGYVNKTNGAGGILTYNSKAFISDSTHKTITSEALHSGNQFSFNVPNGQIYISLLSSDDEWVNSTLLFSAGTGLPTPTQTPIIGDYIISVTPEYSMFGQTLTGLLERSSGLPVSGVNAVAWQVQTIQHGVSSYAPLYEVGSTTKRLDYYLKSSTGHWMGWDEATNDWTNDKGVSVPNPVTFIPQTTGDAVTIECKIGETAGNLFTATEIVNIGGTAAPKNLGVYVKDGDGGGYIPNANVGIYLKDNETFINKTTNNAGYTFFTFPSGTKMTIYANANGYDEGSDDWELNKDGYATITLYPTGLGSTNLTETQLLVKTYQDNEDGTVSILSGCSLYLKYGNPAYGTLSGTTSGGTASITVLNQTGLTITASKSGYTSATKSIVPSGAAYQVSLYLIPLSSTNVPTPVPSITSTPIATPTPSGNLTVCRRGEDMPKDSSPVEIMKNNIACWGVEDLESQNLAFAALIILVCALVLGKIGKGTGAAIGGIIGFILAFAMHFVPFYIVVLALILIGAYFANKFLGSGK